MIRLDVTVRVGEVEGVGIVSEQIELAAGCDCEDSGFDLESSQRDMGFTFKTKQKAHAAVVRIKKAFGEKLIACTVEAEEVVH